MSVVLAWACGGQSLSTTEGDGGTGGSSTGGTGTGGTTGGSSTGGTGTGGTTGGTSTGGTGSGWTGGSSTGGTGTGGTTGGTGAGGAGGSCLAFPTCPPGEAQIPGPEYCLAGGACHQVSLCGATIWCGGEPACNAVPTCDAGDTELSGPCPPDVSCYSRTLCKLSIWCLDRCNPDTEPNREYLLKECAPGDMWSCSPPTTSFVNECGCGCEQDSTCPPSFYCQRQPTPMPQDAAEPELPNPGGTPGAAPIPFCDEAELARCPFTDIVY